MLRLFSKHRPGDNKRTRKRIDRFMKKNKLWYFKTREGFEVGPFHNQADAQYALLYFVQGSDWPSDHQLSDFIEGCQLNMGIAA